MKARNVLSELNVSEDVINAFTNTYFRDGKMDVERGGGGDDSVNGSQIELVTPRRVGDRGGR